MLTGRRIWLTQHNQNQNRESKRHKRSQSQTPSKRGVNNKLSVSGNLGEKFRKSMSNLSSSQDETDIGLISTKKFEHCGPKKDN